MLFRAAPFTLSIAVLLALRSGSTFAADDTGFAKVVPPFLKEHCAACHGPEKQKGKLRLDTLANDFNDPAVVSKWAEVLKQVNARQMPPEDEAQPTAEAAGKFAEWLEVELARGSCSSFWNC